jgi:hypothetical protein
MGLGQVSPDTLAAAMAAPRRHAGHSHAWEGGLSRRQFLRTAGAASGAVVAATALRPALAFADAGSVRPRPIPYGLPGSVFGDPHNTHFYHVLPPLPPGSDGKPGQYIDCSTITDFNGMMAAANINGTGTGTATPGNPGGRFTFNVDMRFMDGTYVGANRKQHEGTFAFV